MVTRRAINYSRHSSSSAHAAPRRAALRDSLTRRVASSRQWRWDGATAMAMGHLIVGRRRGGRYANSQFPGLTHILQRSMATARRLFGEHEFRIAQQRIAIAIHYRAR